MPASTLLVTVHGPFKPMDLELPGDVPVSELIPLILEICGSQENDPKKGLQASVSLQIEGIRTPLSSEITLADAKVCDGTVLELRTHDAPSIPIASLAPRNVRYNR